MGFFLWNLTWYVKTFFHMLTCVERYLAVVHPVIYLSLRRERGIRIRNISFGCVWLLSFGASLISFDNVLVNMDVSLFIFSLFVISFCSLSVLCVLIRPGPVEQGGDREIVKAEGFLHHYGHTGSANVEMLQESGCTCCKCVEQRC